MKNKGTIRFFAIALAIVSIFHLSFTLVTYLQEKKASEYAEIYVNDYKLGKESLSRGQIDSVINYAQKEYLDSIAYKKIYNILLRKYTYAECKERELNLGLDLQGGMHITLEVSLEGLLRELSNNNMDPYFVEAIKIAKDKQKNGQKDFITYFEESFYEIDPTGRLSTIFATLENKAEISLNSSNEDIIKFLREKSKGALSSTYEVIHKRIDKFGVTQPNIQRLEGTGRIIVELPGVDDPERIRKLLQGTAKLEFWETYENKDVIPFFEDANKVLKDKLALELNYGSDTSVVDSTKETKSEFFSGEEKAGDEFFSKQEETKKDFFSDKDTEEAKKDTIEDEDIALKDDSDTSKDTSGESILAQMDDTTESDTGQLSAEEFYQENPLYKVLYPNINNTDQGTFAVKGPVVGMALGADTATVNRYLSYKEVKNILPPDLKFAWTAKPDEKTKTIYQLVALKVTTLDKKAPLDGKVITNARIDVNQFGERNVGLNMNSEGAQTWKQLTGRNIGNSIAIVLDGYVYSYPTVQNEISGGRSTITGSFSNAEASDLSNILNSGKLDVKINVIEEAIVGPSLGQESINSGLMSLIIGLVLVLVFMVLYYNRSGYVADLALFANLFFILGVLSSLGAALTLPGMAGIVLTIGMSVDANVLIFERIREELAGGKGIKLAIKDGYRKAYSSIIDANLTTLLVGIILFTFGQGPIHGFATILIIGICTSLFSAILITRIIFDTSIKKERDIKFSTKISNNAFKNFNFNFVGARKKAYIASAAVIIIGVGSLFTQGLEQGVDFKGGFSYQVRFDKNVNTAQITNLLAGPLNGQPEVKVFGPSNQVKITTSFLVNDPDENASDSVESILNTNLLKIGDNNFEILSRQKVGPTIAEDIKVSARWSVIFSLLVIFLYIFIRFKKWQYGIAAVITLAHDVLIILSLFSIFRNIMPFSLEIDQAFIAALLTVIGYSINDTVVVFDRIREKLTMFKTKPFEETINTALNETLSRTVITSLTTLLVIIILFIFGGEIIRGFSFALLIGVLVGTYSSLFVSTPMVVEFTKKEQISKNE